MSIAEVYKNTVCFILNHCLLNFANKLSRNVHKISENDAELHVMGLLHPLAVVGEVSLSDKSTIAFETV